MYYFYMLKNIYLSIFYTVFMSRIYFCMLSNCDIVFNIFLQQDMGTKIQLPRFCSHLRTKITCHHLKLLLRILIKQFLLMSTLDQTLETLVTCQISIFQLKNATPILDIHTCTIDRKDTGSV